MPEGRIIAKALLPALCLLSILAGPSWPLDFKNEVIVTAGEEQPEIRTWSEREIVIKAPSLEPGRRKISLVTKDGKKSNSHEMLVLEAKLVPIRFTDPKMATISW